MPDFATALARFRRRASTRPATPTAQRKYLEALAADFDRECVEYDRRQQFEREVRQQIAASIQTAGARS